MSFEDIYMEPDIKRKTKEDYAIKYSKSRESRNFITLRRSLGALNVVVETTEDDYWIDKQRALIDNLIETAQVSYKIPKNKRYNDEYKGWISHYGGRSYEVPLYESYAFLYITEFLYIIKDIGWLDRSEQNRKWWNSTLAFIEKDIWTKWYDRSFVEYGNNYRIFLRQRVHMGSHWAGIAMYLDLLTSSSEIKMQTTLLTEQYDVLLKRNLRKSEGGYIWNSTYDDVEGTFARKSSEPIVQDVMHGNHVVTYIIAAYEFGNKNWSLEDIKKISYTLKEFIYDMQNNSFQDRVDGSKIDGSNHEVKPGRGNFVADGWVKLSNYDKDVRDIFEKFEKTRMLEKHGQTLQFKANLHKGNWKE